ncbi:hypothetical protein BX070DRAFT_49839 [Coemansia spiralis]|nr:hypothetical protein BX070DRAFT_49839 [Coemansia spiralis]
MQIISGQSSAMQPTGGDSSIYQFSKNYSLECPTNSLSSSSSSSLSTAPWGLNTNEFMSHTKDSLYPMVVPLESTRSGRLQRAAHSLPQHSSMATGQTTLAQKQQEQQQQISSYGYTGNNFGIGSVTQTQANYNGTDNSTLNGFRYLDTAILPYKYPSEHLSSTLRLEDNQKQPSNLTLGNESHTALSSGTYGNDCVNRASLMREIPGLGLPFNTEAVSSLTTNPQNGQNGQKSHQDGTHLSGECAQFESSIVARALDPISSLASGEQEASISASLSSSSVVNNAILSLTNSWQHESQANTNSSIYQTYHQLGFQADKPTQDFSGNINIDSSNNNGTTVNSDAKYEHPRNADIAVYEPGFDLQDLPQSFSVSSSSPSLHPSVLDMSARPLSSNSFLEVPKPIALEVPVEGSVDSIASIPNNQQPLVSDDASDQVSQAGKLEKSTKKELNSSSDTAHADPEDGHDMYNIAAVNGPSSSTLSSNKDSSNQNTHLTSACTSIGSNYYQGTQNHHHILPPISSLLNGGA